MSKFDDCIYGGYCGEYSLRYCSFPHGTDNNVIDQTSCRKCLNFRSRRQVLLKCPLCGGKASLQNYMGEWHIRCCHCGVALQNKKIDTIISIWNKRI